MCLVYFCNARRDFFRIVVTYNPAEFNFRTLEKQSAKMIPCKLIVPYGFEITLYNVPVFRQAFLTTALYGNQSKQVLWTFSA